MVRVLVRQRPDPEGRPDRRLSGAVECMVAITNFGATGRGAGKFLHGRLRFGSEIGEKCRGVRPARRPRGCEVAVERLPEGVADRGDIAPDGRTPQRPRRSRVAFAVRVPAGMSFEADGLEHPDQIVEMARVEGIARRLTLANSSAISRVRRPNPRGLWRTPWRCHRSGSCFGGHWRKRATRTSSAQWHQICDLGRRIYPKTRGQGRR
jgi:hypothetical protein